MPNPLSNKPTRITPVLKWPGGKRWLVSQHPKWFAPPGSVRHIEAFLGGAAAFFHAAPESAILTDANAELISTYQAIRDDYLGVLMHLRNHHRLHSASHYYKVRKSRPRTEASAAARFIYLNRTCFNGIFRVNLKGEFNVPIGTKTNVLLNTDEFETVAGLLKRAILDASDFRDTIDLAGNRDFLYLDPPYTVKHNNNNFLKYNEKIFSWADQERLAGSALEAAQRGSFVLISNADHASVRYLYRHTVWKKVRIHRFSKLASSSEKRKPTTELVISNYLSETGELESART